MNYLLMGGGGFIGSNLCQQLLLEHSNHIKVYDRNRTDDHDSRVGFIQGDFFQDNSFDRILVNIDIVVHLISTTTPATPFEYISRDIIENILPTINLLDSCVKAGVKKIVFLSSGGAIYGDYQHRPYQEGDLCMPISAYGIQKVAIEYYLSLYKRLRGLNFTSLRLSNPFGPGQRPNTGQGAVATFAKNIIDGVPIKIYGDGDIVRDYIYILDAVKMITKLLNTETEFSVFNIGSGKGRTLLRLIRDLEKVMNKDAEIIFLPARETDVKYSVLNISRYRELIDPAWTENYHEGLERTVEYLKEIQY